MGHQDRTPNTKRQGLGRRTCLYCFHAFRIERGHAACPRCGEQQSKLEQDRFWTLQPIWKRRQGFAGVVSVIALVALAVFLAMQIGSDGASLFWGLGMLVMAGFLLLETVGLLTRRNSSLPLRFLWPAVLLCIAFGPILFSILLHFIGGQAQAGMRWQVGLMWAGPWLVPFVASLWLPGWLRRQRAACLRSGPGD
ncbi:MAG: hypothetical protein ACI89E_000699 [Planctomycetota bacterium]|jgi:hypothetical protein